MKNIIMIFLLCMLIGNCKKATDNTTEFFPEVQVNITLNLNLAQYAALNNLLGYVYLPEGHRGIIVYHTADDRFVAFDRTCPVNTSQACAFVSVDSTATYYRCGQYDSGWKGCCNSKFEPAYGTPMEGEAKRGLKQYYTATSRDAINTTVYISSIPF